MGTNVFHVNVNNYNFIKLSKKICFYGNNYFIFNYNFMFLFYFKNTSKLNNFYFNKQLYTKISTYQKAHILNNILRKFLVNYYIMLLKTYRKQFILLLI